MSRGSAPRSSRTNLSSCRSRGSAPNRPSPTIWHFSPRIQCVNQSADRRSRHEAPAPIGQESQPAADRRACEATEAIADVNKSESPAWGGRGFPIEKRRVGSARFMSRSTAADKGSTDNGAGLGPCPFLQAVRSVGCSSTGPPDSRTILVTSAGRNRSKISSRSRAISRVRTSLKGGTS